MTDRFDDWSVTADNNTTVASINIAEEMAAAGVNNAMRAIMASAALSFGGFPEGTSRPSIVAAGSMWMDTTTATDPILKLYDGSDDITFATFDYSANTVTFALSAITLSGELQLDGVVQTPADVFTSSSNAVELVMTGSSKATLTLDENTTITVSAEVADQVKELWIKQGSSGGTAAWSGVDQWIGGSAPTLSTTAGERDIIILASATDGSTIVAQHIGVAS